MTSPFQLFKTDDALETEGIVVDYGDFWFRVARAGGANKRYGRILQERLKPHRRAIQTETMPDALARVLAIETFAEGVVLGWGSKKHGEGNMVGADGEAIAYSTQAAVALLTALPDLYHDLKDQTERVANFRRAEKEDDAKN